MSSEKQIFTLKQVTSSIQKTIQERYQNLYWVHAEMHKLNFTNKGHCYPELVQKQDGKIVAEMRGTIWSTQFQKISKHFQEVVKEPLRDGLSLLFQVRINFHPLYGMGLEIIDIDPTYTLGELHKEREETLRKLLKEGLLNKNQLLKIPLLPKRIAIISIASSKGLSDFYSVLNSNEWNYRFFTHLFPAQLNGDAAILSVQQQLKRIEKFKDHFDVVAIIRGGGGEIGLSCFNNYELAKSIANFPLPILTGIGHSTNITVVEMIAYKSAITPTELADVFIQSFHNVAIPLKEMLGIISTESKRLIEFQQQQIRNEVRLFKNVSQTTIIQERQKIKNYNNSLKFSLNQLKNKLKNKFYKLNQKFNYITINYSQSENNKLNNFIKLLKINLRRLTQNKLNVIQENHSIIHKSTKNIISNQAHKLNLKMNTIQLLDPENLLKKGYSITTKNGKIISASNPIKAGDTIETMTHSTKIKSSVNNIEKRNGSN